MERTQAQHDDAIIQLHLDILLDKRVAFIRHMITQFRAQHSGSRSSPDYYMRCLHGSLETYMFLLHGINMHLPHAESPAFREVMILCARSSRNITPELVDTAHIVQHMTKEEMDVFEATQQLPDDD